MKVEKFSSRRGFIQTIGATGFSLLGARAFAQSEWPVSQQPVRIVVTQGAGSGSDVVARLLASEMQTALGHSVIVDNRPGAAGTMGHSHVAKSPADGHTLIFSSTGLLLVTPEIMAGNHAKYTDFTPVAAVNEASYVVLVPEQAGAPRTLAELRAQLADGRGTFGSSGAGTMAFLASSLILGRTGLKAEHIAYKTNAQVLQDLAGGRITFACDSLASAKALLQAGRVRALAVTGAQRMSSLPDVPTLPEAGLEATQVITTAGLLAPRGISPALVEKIDQAVRKATSSPAFVERMNGLESPARYLSSAQYAVRIEADAKLWRGLVKQLNLQAG